MDKKKKKDQFIIAYIADFIETETVISHAIWLSTFLKKGLVLLYICDPYYTKSTPEEAEKELSRIIGHSDRLKDCNATYAVLKGETAKIIEALPTLLGAVTVVAHVDAKAHGRKATTSRAILNNFSKCRSAFLVAQEPLRDTKSMDNIAMAVDFRKESKDKFIWSSYFPRFSGSKMHVLYYDYKDEFLRNKWYANMKQLHKLYTDLEISFQPHIMESKSTYQDINAIRYAAANNYGLLISVTTKEKDGLEFFIGVQESRTIINKERIPILFLNPREDLYVLCD